MENFLLVLVYLIFFTLVKGQTCGDGIIEAPEECDGSTMSVVCADNCTFISVCGNGVVEGDEECDDGNFIVGDSCNTLCKNSTTLPPCNGTLIVINYADSGCYQSDPDIDPGAMTWFQFSRTIFDNPIDSDSTYCPAPDDSHQLNVTFGPPLEFSAHAEVTGLYPPVEFNAAMTIYNESTYTFSQWGDFSLFFFSVSQESMVWADPASGESFPQFWNYSWVWDPEEWELPGGTVCNCILYQLTNDISSDIEAPIRPNNTLNFTFSILSETGEPLDSRISPLFPPLGTFTMSYDFSPFTIREIYGIRITFNHGRTPEEDIILDRPTFCFPEIPPGCGNNITENHLEEECDTVNRTLCTENCTIPFCGDGFLSPEEECDPVLEPNNCTSNCTSTVCGDGIIEAPEECDGSTMSVVCADNCTFISVCGNGVVEGGEECDDGNFIVGDSCNTLCQNSTTIPPCNGTLIVINYVDSGCYQSDPGIDPGFLSWLGFSKSVFDNPIDLDLTYCPAPDDSHQLNVTFGPPLEFSVHTEVTGLYPPVEFNAEMTIYNESTYNFTTWGDSSIFIFAVGQESMTWADPSGGNEFPQFWNYSWVWDPAEWDLPAETVCNCILYQLTDDISSDIGSRFNNVLNFTFSILSETGEPLDSRISPLFPLSGTFTMSYDFSPFTIREIYGIRVTFNHGRTVAEDITLYRPTFCFPEIPPGCGNNITENHLGEVCDDGTLFNTSTCAENCTLIPECGNNVIEGLEECDDVNRTVCTEICTTPFCGDGILSPEEECDYGIEANCSSACTFPVCGNNITEGLEECDDGANSNADDGCQNNCLNTSTVYPECNGTLVVIDDLMEGFENRHNLLTNPDLLYTITQTVTVDPFRALRTINDTIFIITPSLTDSAIVVGGGIMQLSTHSFSQRTTTIDWRWNDTDIFKTMLNHEPLPFRFEWLWAGLEFPVKFTLDVYHENGTLVYSNTKGEEIPCGFLCPIFSSENYHYIEFIPEHINAHNVSRIVFTYNDTDNSFGGLDARTNIAITPRLCLPYIEPGCGNGIVEILSGEECDDPNGVNNEEACTPLCKLPTCGDFIITPETGEQCDDGPLGSILCSVECLLKKTISERIVFPFLPNSCDLKFDNTSLSPLYTVVIQPSGEPTSGYGGEPGLIDFPFKASGDGDGGAGTSYRSLISDVDNTEGVLWGQAYHSGTKTMLLSSFISPNSFRNLSITNSMGKIYKYTYADDFGISGSEVELWLDLNDLMSVFYPLGFLGVDSRDGLTMCGSVGNTSCLCPSGLPCWNHDSQGVDGVYKIGIGGMAMAIDEASLWFVSATEKTINKAIFSSVSPTLDPPNSFFDVISYLLEVPESCENEDDYRPWVVYPISTTEVLIGSVCSGEQDSQQEDVHLYVQMFDTATMSYAVVVEILDMTYSRGSGIPTYTHWINSSSFPQDPVVAGNIASPVVTGLSVDSVGNIYIGISNRVEQQLKGFGHPSNTSAPGPYFPKFSGETLLACINEDGSYSVENNGVCGVVKNSLLGQNNGQGLGGGEFFYDDNENSLLLLERGGGSLDYIEGDTLVSTFNTPITLLSPTSASGRGVIRYDLETGGSSSVYEFYSATSMINAPTTGSITHVCLVETEIKGVVWMDEYNEDGIRVFYELDQDFPISGITVRLHNDTEEAVIATTVTDINGVWRFGTFDGIETNSAYTVDVDPMEFSEGQTLYKHVLTLLQQGSNITIDSNGVSTPFDTVGVFVMSGGVATCTSGWDMGFVIDDCENSIHQVVLSNVLCTMSYPEPFVVEMEVDVHMLSPRHTAVFLAFDKYENGPPSGTIRDSNLECTSRPNDTTTAPWSSFFNEIDYPNTTWNKEFSPSNSLLQVNSLVGGSVLARYTRRFSVKYLTGGEGCNKWDSTPAFNFTEMDGFFKLQGSLFVNLIRPFDYTTEASGYYTHDFKECHFTSYIKNSGYTSVFVKPEDPP